MPSRIIADRRLWVTEDDQVVEDGDPRARFLLAGCAGRRIPAAVAERLGITISKGRIEYPGAPKPELVPDDPEAELEGEPDEPAPDWPGRGSPEKYLERYPTGPKAELAAAHIAANAGADGGS